jgi:hypothetical protein
MTLLSSSAPSVVAFLFLPHVPGGVVDEDEGIARLVVGGFFFSGEVFERAFDKAELEEPVGGARGEEEELAHPEPGRLVDEVGDDFFACAEVGVHFIHRDAGDLGALVGEDVERAAGVERAVDLIERVVGDLHFDIVAAAGDEDVFLDEGPHEPEDVRDVGVDGGADVLVRIGVDHGAQAAVTEDFLEEHAFLAAVDDVHALDAGLAGAVGEGDELVVVGLGAVFVDLEEGFGLRRGELGDNVLRGDIDAGRRLEAVGRNAAEIGDEEDLGGLERGGGGEGELGGGDVVGLARARPADVGEDGDEARGEEVLDDVRFDPVHDARALEVDALDDAHAPRLHPVADDGVAVVLGEERHDLVTHIEGRHLHVAHRLQRRHAHAVHGAAGDVGGDEDFVDAGAGAGHDHDLDPHFFQQHNVLDEEREEGVGEQVPLQADDEGVALEAVDVAEGRADRIDLFVEGGKVRFHGALLLEMKV